MKKIIIGFIFAFFLLGFLNFLSSPISADENQSTCFVYFTGIGCPHCAQVDPFVLEQLPEKYPNLVIIEYEVYQERQNAPLIEKYHQVYGSGLGIPLVIIGQDRFIAGDKPILDRLQEEIEKGSNPCPLIDGSSVFFEELDLSSLPGKPKIWPESAAAGTLSGEIIASELTLAKVLSLAAVDAVNPCALAVLALMLLAILAFSPDKRKNILLAGLAFTSAVFIMYFFYGLVIIRFFQLIQALTNIRLGLYKALGVAAIILGVLNLKDFIRYKDTNQVVFLPKCPCL